MTLDAEMTLLADGFRRRFKRTGKLGIRDMIKIVTPPNARPNLLLGTDDFSGDNWASWQIKSTSVGPSGLVGKDAYVPDGSIGYKTTMEPGTYTFSCFACVDASADWYQPQIGFSTGKLINLSASDLTTEWKRFSTTVEFNQQTTGKWVMQVVGSGSTASRLHVAGYKLEKGNTMTAYIDNKGDVIEVGGGN